MRTFYLRFVQAFCGFLLLFGTLTAQAQFTAPCPVLTGQSDTFFACKFSNPFLPTDTIRNIIPGTQITDTVWIDPITGQPAQDLSNNDSLTTRVLLTNVSRPLRLELRSVRPNINMDSNFDGGTFTSDYINGGNIVPLPQYYAITTNPVLVSQGFESFTDHTGNPNGKMMVCNGATLANKVVYRKSFPAATGITAYRIQFYVSAVSKTNPPSFQIYVNGRPIVPPPVLPIPSLTLPDWRQIGGEYSVPAGVTTMNVEIVDQERADGGNDFAIDDLTVRPICLQKDSTYVRVFNLRPLLEQALGSPRYGCERDTFDFTADTTQPGLVSIPKADVPDRYLWSFGDGTFSTQRNPRHFYTTQDTFKVKLFVYKDGVNKGQTLTCSDSVIRMIDNRRPFHAGYIQDKDTICRGETVNFQDTSKPNTLQIKYYFGTGDSSVFRNNDYTYDTAGRFRVMQVVTDAFGCKDTAQSMVIAIGPIPLSFSLTDTVICEGQTIAAQALIDSSYQNYSWNFGDGRIVNDSVTISHTYVDPGTYTILFTATHPVCPGVFSTRSVEVVATPEINLGRDTTICPMGQPILLQNLTTTNDPATQYIWNTGDRLPSLLARHDGVYFLQGSNKLGCSSSDTLFITKNCFLDVPSSFTPDGDNVNDFFLPRQSLASGLMTFKMKIYNRWGQQVYQTERTDGRGWDGKYNGIDQPTGVYLYFIEATLQNGMNEKYDGNVTLLR